MGARLREAGGERLAEGGELRLAGEEAEGELGRSEGSGGPVAHEAEQSDESGDEILVRKKIGKIWPGEKKIREKNNGE